jgi:ankyrin repeat protein
MIVKEKQFSTSIDPRVRAGEEADMVANCDHIAKLKIKIEPGPFKFFKFFKFSEVAMKRSILLLACVLFGALCGSAAAQLPPRAAEIGGYTDLLAAAHKGDVAQIRKLIAEKVELNVRDAYGRTPLHVATFARQREAIRVLIAAGARTDLLENDRYDAVTIASVADDDETLRVLLSLGASAKLTTSIYDGTALIAAAHLGHDGVVKQLIAAGAPLDHVNNLHWTALIESIVLGDGGRRHVECLRALVQAGANTQLTDGIGDTPLKLAKSRGYREMVAILEKAGAK